MLSRWSVVKSGEVFTGPTLISKETSRGSFGSRLSNSGTYFSWHVTLPFAVAVNRL